MVLSQRKVDSDSNEITAVPELLDRLEIAGCIVTLDAIRCQTETVKTIVDKQADYVLPVKENQLWLFETLQGLFDDPAEMRWVACDHSKTVDKGHGRIEIRECWSTSDPEYLRYIATLAEWQGLQSIAMVQTERREGDKTTVKHRYFISSLEPDAKRLAHAIRSHWAIEITLHWTLDMSFGEDDSRMREGYSAENFAMMRRMALGLMKRDPHSKRSLKGRRKICNWSNDYLERLLFNSDQTLALRAPS